MPRAYDNDLRRKLLAAHAAGKGSQLELAQLFGVSLGWVEKLYRQQRQSGQADRVEQRHGPVSRVDSAAKTCLLRAMEDRPDLTLAELQRVLAEQQGVRLCIAQVWNVLKRLGVRLKKTVRRAVRDGGTGVRQHPLQQAAESFHAARAEEGRRAMEALLSGAQHREAGTSRVCAVGSEASIDRFPMPLWKYREGLLNRQ